MTQHRASSRNVPGCLLVGIRAQLGDEIREGHGRPRRPAGTSWLGVLLRLRYPVHALHDSRQVPPKGCREEPGAQARGQRSGEKMPPTGAVVSPAEVIHPSLAERALPDRRGNAAALEDMSSARLFEGRAGTVDTVAR